MSFDSQQYSDDDDLHDGDGRNEIYIPVLLHAGQADKQNKKMKCEKIRATMSQDSKKADGRAAFFFFFSFFFLP